VLASRPNPSVTALPEKVDCGDYHAADTVPDLIAEAVELGIPSGIVISAGFKERCARKELERRIAQTIRGKMRLIGPNCLGVITRFAG